MYNCDCAEENALTLTKKTFFCILSNYLIFCKQRNLGDYSKQVKELQLFHSGNDFSIKLVSSHDKVSFRHSNKVSICLYSKCCKTKLAKALDEAAASEFRKLMSNHCCNYRDLRIAEHVQVSKVIISHLSPKNF